MKKLIVTILVIAYTLTSVVNAQAMQDDQRELITVQAYDGNGKMTYAPRPIAEHKDRAEITSPVLMQDLTQCVMSTNGQELLCVDVCGGRSAPYTICSYE